MDEPTQMAGSRFGLGPLDVKEGLANGSLGTELRRMIPHGLGARRWDGTEPVEAWGA